MPDEALQNDTPTSDPSPAPVSVTPPRPLDQIHADLVQAKQRHADAVQAVKESGGLVHALAAEMEEALSFFQEQVDAVKADVDDGLHKVADWLREIL